MAGSESQLSGITLILLCKSSYHCVDCMCVVVFVCVFVCGGSAAEKAADSGQRAVKFNLSQPGTAESKVSVPASRCWDSPFTVVTMVTTNMIKYPQNKAAVCLQIDISFISSIIGGIGLIKYSFLSSSSSSSSAS